MMVNVHSEEKFLIGAGLGRILLKAMLPIGTGSVILMVFVLIFYLKKRMISYSMFLVLGARKKTLYIRMALEICFSLICSLVFGCLLGNGILFFLRKGIAEFIGNDFLLSRVTWLSGLKMFGVTVLIYLVSFMGARDIARDMHLVSASARKVRGEKMPWKGLRLLLIAVIVLLVWSVFSYSQLRNFEDIKLLGVYFVGVFLVLRYGGAAYLHKLKRGKQYLSKLMERNYFYHRSRTTAWYLLALTVINICVAFCFTFQTVSVMVAEEGDTLYPYDFVCIADEEDDRFFQKLQDTYDLEIATYPMVRVSSADGTPMVSPAAHAPQGQHIGISETTYHALKRSLDGAYKEQSLGLDGDGKKVYIVHQQDRSIQAQPTDFKGNRKRPYLHIGCPCIYYSKTAPEKISGYPSYGIAGEEIGSLTGCFRQGLQENIIVFSDDYFEKAQDMWEYTDFRTGKTIEEEAERILNVTIRQGPSRLVLIKAREEDVDDLEVEMNRLSQSPNHVYESGYSSEVDCYYSKKEAVRDLKTERIMKKIVNISVIVTLMVTFVFLMLIKVFSEMEEKKQRSKFLRCMGMQRKERLQILKKELYLFYWIPAVITVISTVCFTFAVFHARMYPAVVIREYLRYAAVIWAICFVVEMLLMVVLDVLVVRKVEGKDE